MIKTERFKLYGQLEEQAEKSDVEAFVYRNGQIIPASEVGDSITPIISGTSEPVYASYWYEKENGSLLTFEKNCYFQFMKEYNHPQQKLNFSYDNKRRFCVDIALPFKAAPDSGWRTFNFHIVYDHNHPGRDADGLFGGSIKIYPLTKLKPGFHHMISDASMGCPYICQVRAANSEDVNGYTAMKRVLRWINVYSVWEKTGVDIDK